MDQPKQERVLRIIQLLAGNSSYTFKGLMKELGVSRRTLFRYLATLKEHDYEVELLPGSKYRLPGYKPKQAYDSESILFTHEEAALLSRLIETLDSTNALKPVLQGKLESVFCHSTVAPYIVRPATSKNVEILTAAIAEHLQVYVKSYECCYKGVVKDYVLEPYQMNCNCVDLWAYDIADGRCKLFKVARLGTVMLLRKGWEHEDAHVRKSYDVFHVSGDVPLERVKLKMNLLAKNLLVEEYPLTMDQVYQEDGFWFWEGPVYGEIGAGRFVLGLCDVVELLEDEKLRAWVMKRLRDAPGRLGAQGQVDAVRKKE